MNHFSRILPFLLPVAGAFLSCPAELLLTYDFAGGSTTAAYTAPGLVSDPWSGNFGANPYGTSWDVSSLQEPSGGAAWFNALAAVTNQTAAIADNGGTYWQTALEFTPGSMGSVTNLTLDLGGERGGGSTSYHDTHLDIQYSLDGFATAGTSLGVATEPNSNNGWNANTYSFDVNEVALTGLDNQVVTFRFYAWIDNLPVDTIYPAAVMESTLDNLQISGILAIPEPGSLLLVGLGAASLLILGRERNR